MFLKCCYCGGFIVDEDGIPFSLDGDFIHIKCKKEFDQVINDINNNFDDFIQEIEEMDIEELRNLLKSYNVKFEESDDNE